MLAAAHLGVVMTARRQHRGRPHMQHMPVQGENMHSNAMQPGRGGDARARGEQHRRRYRTTRRWCLSGFVAIPLLLGFLWLQFVSAMSDGELFYGGQMCDCSAAVTMWVQDYVWTQMIWLPGNMIFLLIWIALAVKLWSGKRSAG